MLKNPKYVYGESDRQILATLHFGEYVLKKIWEHKDNVAMINASTDEPLIFRQIAQEALNIAVSLMRMGVKKGDVIAICSENRGEFWSTAIGIFCTGAVVTTINTMYTKDEIKHVLGISKPKYVFCSPLTYKRNGKSFKMLEKIFLFGNESERNTIPYNYLAKPSNLLAENVQFEDFVCADVIGQTDTALILYSSGTTGLPKGVMLTHLNVITACTPFEVAVPTVILTITPWYHSMGLITGMRTLILGSKVVFLPKFDVQTYFKTIEKYQVKALSVVPPVLVALSKVKEKYNTSSVISVSCGAAPLYEETANMAKNIFPNLQGVFQGYGMTESTLLLTMNLNTEKIGSVGTVYHNTILKIVDPDTKKVLGSNERGEIYAKGLSIMKGYIGKGREDFDDEGFFKTGDVGYYDDEKYFYIVDRLKELIKYKGYQVAPAEIEAILLQHSGIREVGVVGLPNVAAGELPLAFVVLQPGVQLTEKEIQDFVAEKLSNPKHLRGGVRFIPEIPKNQTGKILRKELRKMLKSTRSKI
ncbi:unnamed protein product [Pieris macdunnoughi]|uniref:Luciferin 4-monooxygenase n=1 Tax=Pieris macdunnoughi TaxID=345717 RepID=A0A821R7C6_9NEOP|nr:unnamed protein product [Pieris macdunnoughi]